MAYIERLVQIGERLESERVLRNGAQVTIVLAEPGAGKTELMKSLAAHFGVQRIRASQFRHKTKFSENPVLIIDGVDEVAKIDQSAVDQLIVKAEELSPTRVFLASRSGQWEHARTVAVKQSFGVEPQIVYPQMHLNSMRRLFDLASISCDKLWLEAFIDQRLTDLEGDNAEAKQSERWTVARDFWRLRKFFTCEQPDHATLNWLSESKERILALEAIASRSNRNDHSGWKELSADKIGTILRVFVDLWPKVHLPSQWGTGDPPEQTAYRFLTDIVWAIGRDTPRKALPVLDELISDPRFVDFNVSLKSIKANVLKQQALEGFEPPTPELITQMLDNQKIACVEDMRALLVEIFEEIQIWLNGSETDPINLFYDKQSDGTFVRKDENGTTKIIADRLKLRCETLGLNVTIELHQRDDNRTDIGILSNLAGQNALLVIEAKGQWHRELYTAAAEQLDARYSIHPNAARQGIYLVYWFGTETVVAGVKTHGIRSAIELRQKIQDNMPTELKARINVVVIDLSR